MNGKREGTGTLIWASGHRYTGHWLDDKQHGIGVLVSTEGKQKKGEWQKGYFVRWIVENQMLKEIGELVFCNTQISLPQHKMVPR